MSTDSGPARVRALLLSSSSLSALVGSDIYTPRFDGAPTLPGIAFRVQGGESDNMTPLRKQSMVFRCYDSTAEESRALYRTMRLALIGAPTAKPAHYTTLRGFNIGIIMEEQEGQEIIDEEGPDKGTPFVLAFFTVKFADQ